MFDYGDDGFRRSEDYYGRGGLSIVLVRDFFSILPVCSSAQATIRLHYFCVLLLQVGHQAIPAATAERKVVSRPGKSLPHKTAASVLSPRNGNGKALVPSLLRAARLLDELAAAKRPLPLAALTEVLRLPKSTVHALCSTLVHTGVVRRTRTSEYQLGMHIMDWSNAILARIDVAVEFGRIADSLNLFPEESLILSVLDGADVIHVGCRNGSRPMGLNYRLGMRMPANTSASGKAILSTLSEKEVAELASAGGLRCLTKKSVTTAAGLYRELAQVRKRGYSIDDEETCEGMMCFGAPVLVPSQSQAVAGVAVSFFKAAVSPRQRTAAIKAIRELAAMLSKRIGGGS